VDLRPGEGSHDSRPKVRPEAREGVAQVMGRFQARRENIQDLVGGRVERIVAEECPGMMGMAEVFRLDALKRHQRARQFTRPPG